MIFQVLAGLVSKLKIHKSVPQPTQVKRRKAQVSRMTREFSQVVTVVDTCHSPVPQMSQYADSDAEMQDTGKEHVGDDNF